MLAKQQATQAGRTYLLGTRDVVREPLLELEVEPFSLDLILSKLEPRRKLLPRRAPRAPEPGSADVPRYVEVVVQGGIDLPVRAGAAEAVGTTKQTVECRFQGHTVSTQIKEGANPIWNQIVQLPMLVPGGDWSQRVLLELRDEITFNLFDQVTRSSSSSSSSSSTKSSSHARE